MKIEKLYFLPITILMLINNLAICSEIVPVYMWGSINSRFVEHVPALHKITQDSFKDPILEDVKNPYIVIFAENTLSPEDFAQRDQYGEIPFSNIHNLKKSTKIIYKSHVQSPIRAVKQINKPITEISVGNLLKNFTVPIDDILIINLNDAKDDEHRFDMLKRHDSDINFIYNKLLEKFDQVLAIYTAYHSSWIEPEEMVHHKRTRSLLAENTKDSTTDNRKLFRTENILMYISDLGTYNHDNKSITINNFSSKSENQNSSIILTLMGDKLDLKFGILLSASNYWYLDVVSVIENGKEINITNSTNIHAPLSFSYHCNDTIFSLNDTRIITLPGFQIQPFWNKTVNENSTFGDAYNCVGFTSIPIWSGLFVTMILLLIMTFGLTMMMDIKTMDRFDDAKGKTITINASE